MTTSYEKRTPEERRAQRDAECLTVLVARCVRCGVECRHGIETQLTDDVRECAKGEHSWKYIGRSHVAGMQPWAGRVPGVLPPGVWELEKGQRVFIAHEAYTVEVAGKYRVELDNDGRAVISKIADDDDSEKAERPEVK